jgi:long-subunit acyl-CoA synthetase (AMP-forming)
MIQGYGLTEATCIVAGTRRDDIMLGSVGQLMPGMQGRLVTPEGEEITRHDQPGELQLRGPNITPGYFNDTEAMKLLMSQDGWLRTGDLIELRQSSQGRSHIFIVDRIKELIKVHVSCSPNPRPSFMCSPSDIS